MVQSTACPIDGQFDSVRDQLKQHQGLPFLQLLSPNLIETACRRCHHFWRQRIYTPSITLAIFLSQILSADHSCDDAVERFQKYRFDRGLPRVATSTGSYCEARQRLTRTLIWELVRLVGRSIQQQANPAWLFHGRAVKIPDGSTVLMPDTPKNQAAFPQARTQAPGVGLPIARILVVFSLAVGTVLEAALGPYKGKQTSELALLRQVINVFQRGDILLADRFFCSYWVIADLQHRGVDVVVRLHQRRQMDFRRGRRLGREDREVTWKKPPRPEWMSRAEYEAMPAELTVRVLRVRVPDKTKRVRKLEIVTTLRDAREYRSKEVGRPLPPAVERGTIYTHVEITDEDGDVTHQEPGDGTQGGGRAFAGVQPDPRDHGGGSACGKGTATATQFRWSTTYHPRVRGGPSLRPGTYRGGFSPALGVDRRETSR